MLTFLLDIKNFMIKHLRFHYYSNILFTMTKRGKVFKEVVRYKLWF